jgi:hypothetical protein
MKKEQKREHVEARKSGGTVGKTNADMKKYGRNEAKIKAQKRG